MKQVSSINFQFNNLSDECKYQYFYSCIDDSVGRLLMGRSNLLSVSSFSWHAWVAAPKAAVSVDKQGKFAAWGISGHLIVVVLGQFSPDMLFVKFRKDGHKTFRKKLL